MGSGIYSIGVSALQSVQLGLATTSHNIANAKTEGYTRQRIIQAANVALSTGAGYVGQGTHVSTIERIYSSYIAAQVNGAQAKVSTLESYATQLGNLNQVLTDEDSGLASALTGFFTGVHTVSSDPASLTSRQTLVSSANSLVSRFQSLNSLLTEQYQSINNDIRSHVTSINSFAQQLAEVNTQIINSKAGNNQPPNDLYDKRDQLVGELNKLIGVKTTMNSDGSYNVYYGNGQQLVTRAQVSTLVAMTSSADPSRVTVGVKTPAGNVEQPEVVFSGGSIEGLLSYRNDVLDPAAYEIGRIATSMALAFNAQHALGQDLSGNVAGDANFVGNFFSLPSPLVTASSLNPGGSPVVSASFQPPSAAADGTFYTNLQPSSYRLQYDGTNLTLTRLSDNVAWSVPSNSVATLNAAIQASPQGAQGFTLAASGAIVTGASYLIEPTRNVAQGMAVNATIAADVRRIAVAAPVRSTAGSANTGAATISGESVTAGYSLASLPATLTYSGGNLTGFPSFPVTVTVNGTPTTYAADPVPYTSGATISFSGISFTISGAPASGDTFTVQRNANGVSDNRNALLLAKLQTGKTMAGNTASLATIYAQLVGDVGNKGSEAKTILDAQKALLTESKKARDSLSGVNLDEEAVKLLEYQQAYQAAAKMLQIASEMFDAILTIR